MKPDFTLGHFKKWIREQKDHTLDDQKKHHIIGTKVESKVPFSKLVNVSSTEDGDIAELIANFQESGGIIADIDGKNFLIEVSTGSFYVPRQFTRPS